MEKIGLNTGDIIFSYNKKSLFSKWIYKIMIWKEKTSPKNKISHVMICMDNDLLAEANENGIVLTNYKKYFNNKYDIYHFEMNLTEKEKNSLRKYIIKNLGMKKYSYGQIFFLFFKKMFNIKDVGDFSETEMMCSEFVYNAFKSIEKELIPNNKKNPAEITPADIYNALDTK